ncbi:MAG: T9SS type A sorting domain-containing protein [Bacteroidales bacterium]|nr:T9SS type A sorting domain-containing protein [Bacteroidales bacterium]
MKKIALLFVFAMLSAPMLKAQNLILPSAHGLTENQPAWSQQINQFQEFSLANGFNWWSSYIDLSGDGLSRLKNCLGNDASLIKTLTTGFIQYSPTTNSWSGNLTEMENGKMYLILIKNESSSFQLEGTVVNPSEVAIEVNTGWNWIGYPCSSPVALTEALADYTPNNNDLIKNLLGYSIYSNGKWSGNLTQLVPGDGYLILRHGDPTSFHFATPSKSEPIVSEIPNTIWKTNAHDFALNMNVLASVKLFDTELNSEDYELGVFFGDECRGTVQLMNVDDKGCLAFLTVYGNEGERLQFRLLDRITGNVYTTEQQPLVYSDNDVLGTLDAPFQIEFRNILSSEETLAGMLKVYPNPLNSQQSLTVTIPENQAPADGVKIQVINLLGQVVKEETMMGDRCSINGLSTGMYTLRVLAGNAMIYNNKLIVK